MESSHPEFVQAIIDKGNQWVLSYLTTYTLSQSHWQNHPEFVQALIDKGDQGVLQRLAIYTLSQPHWKDHPEFVQALIDKGDQEVLRELSPIYSLPTSIGRITPNSYKLLSKKENQYVLWST